MDFFQSQHFSISFLCLCTKAICWQRITMVLLALYFYTCVQYYVYPTNVTAILHFLIQTGHNFCTCTSVTRDLWGHQYNNLQLTSLDITFTACFTSTLGQLSMTPKHPLHMLNTILHGYNMTADMRNLAIVETHLTSVSSACFWCEPPERDLPISGIL